jgi:Flp pilus assembly protein CpaB
MRSRSLVVVLALILATLATVGVFLYARGVKEDAKTGGDLVTVVVSKDDIPANTDLNTLIADDGFTTLDIPQDALVEDAVTDVNQLKNRRNSVFIVAGEQIPLSRVEGGEVLGGVLSIPEGYQAITVSLEAPRAVGAAVTGGDNVTVLATFNDVVIEEKGKKNQQQTTTGTATGQGQAEQTVRGEAATVVLVPQVQVLRVLVPQAGGVEETATSAQDEDIAVTLALLPEDAQKFVFALEEGTVYLSLLPPDGEGVELEPLTVDSIVNPPKAKGNQE